MKRSEKIGTILTLVAICLMYLISKPIFIVYIIASIFNYMNNSMYTQLDAFNVCKKSYEIAKELINEIKREIDED